MTKSGIDVLCYAVRVLARCKESFNQRFSAEQLLRIADAFKKIDKNISPDSWTERQLQECVQFGIVPRWDDNDSPKYRTDMGKIFKVNVSWTSTATVEIYGNSIDEVTNWAEGDMPTPKDGKYVDDTFVVQDVQRIS